jgi:GAF domain-containing protein
LAFTPCNANLTPGRASSSALTRLIGAPIRLDEQLYGYLYVANKRCWGTFTSEDEEPVVAIATAAAAAIENARLLSLERRRQQWMEASLEMTRVLPNAAGPRVSRSASSRA